jgi:hypothetical protein
MNGETELISYLALWALIALVIILPLLFLFRIAKNTRGKK